MTSKLPIHTRPTDADDTEASTCGPKVYVTNEEGHILAEIRAVRARAEEIRTRLEACTDEPERQRLRSELEAARTERAALVKRREAAYRRKMIMLGHIEPTAEDLELFPELDGRL